MPTCFYVKLISAISVLGFKRQRFIILGQGFPILFWPDTPPPILVDR